MPRILYIVPSEHVKRNVFSILVDHYNNHLKAFPSIEYVDVNIRIVSSVTKLEAEDLNADVIVARGILAAEIANAYPEIPIVEIPVTTTDLFSALNLIKDNVSDNEAVALIGLGAVHHQAHTVTQQSGIGLVPMEHDYKPDTQGRISVLFDMAIKQGYRHFLGGTAVVKLAKNVGLEAGFVDSCVESTWMALTQAQHLAAIRRHERERAERFEKTLNCSTEGIITINADLNIVQANVSAGRILGINPQTVVGLPIESLITDHEFRRLLRNNQCYSNVLIRTKAGQLVLNKIATSLGDESIGAVISFQEVTQVQSTEISIRNKLYHREFYAKYTFDDIVGESSEIQKAIDEARVYADAPSSVLILGASGTGKELFAQSIHNASERVSAPFVAVNCAAIPDNLLESEFFGYKAGAFTGASGKGKAGLFEIAHRGTIFLDEVSEIPMHLQSKLLRIVQEGEVMRLGHDRVMRVDVRIICASNKDLRQLVHEGEFRADLFYRLAVLQLQIPPLSARGADIPLLARRFLWKFAREMACSEPMLTEDAADCLMQYLWEGNVRELSNVCEQLLVLNKSATINKGLVSRVLKQEISTVAECSATSLAREFLSHNASSEITLNERDVIITMLQECRFNRGLTAERLGMNRSTLWRKMKGYQIDI